MWKITEKPSISFSNSRLHRLRRHVAAGERRCRPVVMTTSMPASAIHASNARPDLRQVVGDDLALHQPMTGAADHFLQAYRRLVGGVVARIRHGQRGGYAAAEGKLVVDLCHGILVLGPRLYALRAALHGRAGRATPCPLLPAYADISGMHRGDGFRLVAPHVESHAICRARRMMPSATSNRALAAVPPSASTTLGATRATCRSRNVRQVSASCGSACDFQGGRQ